MATYVRELDRTRDRRAIEALDTGFETDTNVARQMDGRLVAVGRAEDGSMTIPPPLDGVLVRLDVR